MTAKIYVRADKDELIVEVTGADPNSNQTASVSLWGTRAPQAAASGALATLAESWNDGGLGASTMRFGSLAAITAGARNVQTSTNGESVTVSFQPNADGSFRVIVGSPKYNGSTAAATAAGTLLGSDASASASALQSAHLDWWQTYRGSVGLVKMTATDSSADCIENLRTMYLYVSPSQFRGEYPGSQAGIGDLFSFNQDSHAWVPQDYWFWNLRMQVAANLSSGAFDENLTIYLSNLANIQTWTKQRMGNRAGICQPETMRFNGDGRYGYSGNQSCDAYSTQPTAFTHNVENLDLEPVWPYDLISDANATEFAVAKRTYSSRRFVGSSGCSADWSNDPIHAARLGLASEVSSTLSGGVSSYQMFLSGFAMLSSTWNTEPYVEQMGVFTTAINEALVQDFDGLIRIAPAIPSAWNISGSVYVQGKTKVAVQYQSGAGGGIRGRRSRNQRNDQRSQSLERGASDGDRRHRPADRRADRGDDAGDCCSAGARVPRRAQQRPTPAAALVTGTAATVVKTPETRRLGVHRCRPFTTATGWPMNRVRLSPLLSLRRTWLGAWLTVIVLETLQ